jgi:hypothetical protein
MFFMAWYPKRPARQVARVAEAVLLASLRVKFEDLYLHGSFPLFPNAELPVY